MAANPTSGMSCSEWTSCWHLWLHPNQMTLARLDGLDLIVWLRPDNMVHPGHIVMVRSNGSAQIKWLWLEKMASTRSDDVS